MSLPDARFDQLVARVCALAAETPGDVRAVVADAAARAAPLLDTASRERLVARAVARLAGLDALDEHLADDRVDEVMVNHGGEIWIDAGGVLSRAGALPRGAIDAVLERVLAPTGKRLDRTTPIVDTRLPDGGRLCAVVAPIAVDGSAVAIRRHRRRRHSLSDFAAPEVVRLLRECLARRLNMLVTGATSSGKTSLLGALVDRVPVTERILVIEDTTELTVEGRHGVRLETRPASVDGPPPIDLAALVRTALRLRPDRLVIGEFRGDEVVAVVQALNTGHDGSLSTCHANSAIDGLRRVETLVLQAAPRWPLAAVRRNVTRSLDIVVHLERDSDGQRRVGEVVEVVESADEPSGRSIVTAGHVTGDLQRSRA